MTMIDWIKQRIEEIHDACYLWVDNGDPLA